MPSSEELGGKRQDLTPLSAANTARKRLGRYLAGGEVALADASSRPQRALDHQTPIQALKAWQITSPQLFKKRVQDLPGLDI